MLGKYKSRFVETRGPKVKELRDFVRGCVIGRKGSSERCSEGQLVIEPNTAR